VQYTGNGILTPTPLTAVRITDWTSTKQAYSVTSPGLVRVMDSTNYYPGWTVSLDAHQTAVWPAPTFGTISFLVPPGNHTVAIELQPTVARRIALNISLLTIAILMIAAAGFDFGWRRELWRMRAPPAAINSALAAGLACELILTALSPIGASGKLPGIFAGLMLLAIVGYAFAWYLRPLIIAGDWRVRAAFSVLAVIAAIKFAILPYLPGFEGDMRLYVEWA
jgi:hypothetical protein